MKKMIFIAASFLAIAACNKPVVTVAPDGFGTLKLYVESDDNVRVVTRSGEDEPVNTAGFAVKVINSKNEVKAQGTASELKSLVLPADTYTVTAENIDENTALTENEGKGALRMAGSKSVELTQGETKSVDVACTPVNSKITVAYSTTFTTSFENYSVDLDHSGDRDFENISSGMDYFYNITDGATVTLKLTATSKMTNEAVTDEHTITLEACHHYAVTYSATTDGQITINITASDKLTEDPITIPVNPYN